VSEFTREEKGMVLARAMSLLFKARIIRTCLGRKALNFNARIKVVPLIEVKTQDLFWNRAHHQKWSQKDMKERIVEERNTRYGKRIVKQIEGKIIIQKIREDKKKEDKKKSKRKKGKK